MSDIQAPRQRGNDCKGSLALFAVKSFHSAAFFVIQTAIFYLLYKGIRGETDRKAGIAAAIATGESLIYAGNRFRCPLTSLAEDLGAENGAVTDIFLPGWLAANVARIYTPLFVLSLALHGRNLRRRKDGPGRWARRSEATPASSGDVAGQHEA